ncbi:hypothetical protein HR52_09845 [Aeromonas hydrophila]|nr:hypothetical protein HR52_09845 [Aeromonas hydrophila]OCA63557.1 hypothetical protein A9R12_16575 [Aeromonas hydrophila]CAD7543409.1 hypothetical protein KBAH04_26700 [Aeromonas hydrophila]
MLTFCLIAIQSLCTQIWNAVGSMITGEGSLEGRSTDQARYTSTAVFGRPFCWIQIKAAALWRRAGHSMPRILLYEGLVETLTRHLSLRHERIRVLQMCTDTQTTKQFIETCHIVGMRRPRAQCTDS